MSEPSNGQDINSHLYHPHIPRRNRRTLSNSPDAVLVNFWRAISKNFGYGNIVTKINEYLLNTRGTYEHTRKFSSDRGNHLKEMNANHMTWKVFCRNLHILGAIKVVFTMKVTWPSGHESTHVEEFNLKECKDKDGECPTPPIKDL